MERTENAVFTVMVMVEDEQGRVLIENKRSSDWGGLVFPGGHVERGEMFTDAAIREVREEAGLLIKDPRVIGVKQFIMDEYRYVVFLFYASEFSGELHASDEGDVFWLTKEELLMRRDEMPVSFDRMLEMFFDRSYTEMCMLPRNDGSGEWNVVMK